MRAPRFRALLVVAVAVVLLQAGAPAGAGAPATPTPRTPIRHLVMLMQENHSFDNYFGTFPGVDGIPADICMPVRPGKSEKGCVKPHHLGATRPLRDHSHDYRTALRQFNGGKMDGFVWALQVRR
jgi:phospholipase C